jgi:hypothetical protein
LLRIIGHYAHGGEDRHWAELLRAAEKKALASRKAGIPMSDVRADDDMGKALSAVDLRTPRTAMGGDALPIDCLDHGFGVFKVMDGC